MDLVVQQNSESESPYIYPSWRPVLVLPSGMADQFSVETLDHVFRHEAAHLVREDAHWICFLRFLSCLFWFHPLVWVISSMHLCACEEAADAAAARSGGTDDYRNALATLALGLLPVSSAASAALIRVPEIGSRLRAVSGNASLSPPSNGLAMLCIFPVMAIGLFLGSIGIAEDKAQEALKEFIRENTIPTLSLEDADLKNAIAVLEKISREVDSEGLGFEIHLSDDFARPHALITLRLTNVPFSEGLRYVSALAGGEYRVTSDGVVFENKTNQKKKFAEEVSEGWELPVKWSAPGLDTKIQTVNFSDTPLKEALAFLEKKTKGQDGSGEGMQIKMADGFKGAESKITLRLSNVKIGDALRYATSLSQAAYLIDGNQVTVMDRKQHQELLFTVAIAAPQRLFPREEDDAKEILIKAGIDFPEGSAAIYKRKTGKLIVRNHQPMIDLIKEWVK